MEENFEAYLKRATHEKSVRAIAERAGMVNTTLQRQLDGEIKVGTVVDICRAYDIDLLPAFVAAGFVSEDEAGKMSAGATLRDATDRQLVEEMLRRIIEVEEEHPDLTNPVADALIDAAEELMDVDADKVTSTDVSGTREPINLFTVPLEEEDLAASTDKSAPDTTRDSK